MNDTQSIEIITETDKVLSLYEYEDILDEYGLHKFESADDSLVALIVRGELNSVKINQIVEYALNHSSEITKPQNGYYPLNLACLFSRVYPDYEFIISLFYSWNITLMSII